MDKYRKSNREMWDEWVGINARSEMYDLEGFKAGRKVLRGLEVEEVGEVQGKTLLHLQCHFGQDTLNWARLGAQVTGVDFSPEGIKLARELSAELGIPARFICCDLYDLPGQLDEQFDVVFTSYGVLTWLSDKRRWAQIAARYVKPGGMFYIAEIHPFGLVFDEAAEPLRIAYPYFDAGVMAFPVQGSYADPTAKTRATTSYEWAYPLGEVVTCLIEAGLTIEFLHEFPFIGYRMFPAMVQGEDGNWRLPGVSLPLLFSIRARKG